jgi:predicted ATPase
MGALPSAWASGRLDGRVTGAMRLRQALAGYIDQGNKTFVPFYQVLLAEIEAQGDSEGALTWIDEALALARETGEHWSDAFLHRLRGEILLKRDPMSTAPAENAFLTAIAVAQQQNARSFELRAASRWRAISFNGPTRRCPCRTRVCAQGHFADPGISRG